MNRQTKPIKLWAVRNRDTKIRSIGFSIFSRHQSLEKKSLWVVSECVIQKLGDRGEHNMSTGRCRQWECEWIDLSDHPRPGWVACSPPPPHRHQNITTTAGSCIWTTITACTTCTFGCGLSPQTLRGPALPHPIRFRDGSPTLLCTKL